MAAVIYIPIDHLFKEKNKKVYSSSHAQLQFYKFSL